MQSRETRVVTVPCWQWTQNGSMYAVNKYKAFWQLSYRENDLSLKKLTINSCLFSSFIIFWFFINYPYEFYFDTCTHVYNVFWARLPGDLVRTPHSWLHALLF